MTFLAKWEPQLRSLMRIVFGLNYLTHGLQKTMGILGGTQLGFDSMAGIAGPIETLGGALILLGLLTRPTAFILSGQMAVAYLTVHAPNALFPIMNGGELATLYCFFYLWLAAAGPGPWSVDGMRGKA